MKFVTTRLSGIEIQRKTSNELVQTKNSPFFRTARRFRAARRLRARGSEYEFVFRRHHIVQDHHHGLLLQGVLVEAVLRNEGDSGRRLKATESHGDNRFDHRTGVVVLLASVRPGISQTFEDSGVDIRPDATRRDTDGSTAEF